MKFLRVLKNNNQISSETVSQAYYPDHISNSSINMVFSGNKTFNIGKRQLNLHPDSFLALNQGTTYSSKIDSTIPVSNLSISFAPLFLKDFHKTQSKSHRALLDDPFNEEEIADGIFLETIYPFTGDMKNNIMHLKQQLEHDEPDDMLINEYLHYCLINYYKIYNREFVDKSANLNCLNRSTKVEILKRLTLAKEFITSNYNKNIELENIAQHACLSVNHLLRTFKQAYGKSPHQYLVQVRIDRSKYLLKNTNYTISEIVEIIGFECPSSFIRLFKNQNRTTPGKFRMSC